MKNKLFVKKCCLDKYICYLIDDKFYQILILDMNTLVSFISNNIVNSELFFYGFSKSDIELLKYFIEDCFSVNYLNDDILYDVDYNICDCDFSLIDYLKDKNLIMKNETIFSITGFLEKEDDNCKIKVNVVKRKKYKKNVKKRIKRF